MAENFIPISPALSPDQRRRVEELVKELREAKNAYENERSREVKG